jgi:hypothetical protein
MRATDLITFDLDTTIAARLAPLDDELFLVERAQEDLWSVRGPRHHDLNILRPLRQHLCVVTWLYGYRVDRPVDTHEIVSQLVLKRTKVRSFILVFFFGVDSQNQCSDESAIISEWDLKE